MVINNKDALMILDKLEFQKPRGATIKYRGIGETFLSTLNISSEILPSNYYPKNQVILHCDAIYQDRERWQDKNINIIIKYRFSGTSQKLGKIKIHYPIPLGTN